MALEPILGNVKIKHFLGGEACPQAPLAVHASKKHRSLLFLILKVRHPAVTMVRFDINIKGIVGVVAITQGLKLHVTLQATI